MAVKPEQTENGSGGGDDAVSMDTMEWNNNATSVVSAVPQSPLTDAKNWSELMDTLANKSKTSPFKASLEKHEDSAFLDDLPLGSEANSISTKLPSALSRVIEDTPALDPRLVQLKALSNTGWTTSFNSELSAQTSASSLNSVDLLLSQRNVDPEQMLRSLGFGFALDQEPSMLRVPLRFLQTSHAQGINIQEFLDEYPELQRLLLKKQGSVGWQSLSKTLMSFMSLKNTPGLVSGQTSDPNNNPPPVNVDQLFNGQQPPPGSILSPENYKALAQKGFYDDNVGKKVWRHRSPSTEKPTDAASKRAHFKRTKSKRWSLVDENILEMKESWTSQSLDEYRGQYGRPDLSSSLDSFDSQMNGSRSSSISEKRREFEEEMLERSGNGRHIEDQFRHLFSEEEEGEVIENSTANTNDTEDTVRIVVSKADKVSMDRCSSRSSVTPASFLNVVNAQIERLSDSGSEHTLIESPQPSMDKSSSMPSLSLTYSEDSLFEDAEIDKKYVSVSSQTSLDNQYRDENDNISKVKTNPVSSKNLQDLPRMASIQSDSSGFGDADPTIDTTPVESDPWVSSLGSSGESAGTLASSSTTVIFRSIPSDRATQTVEAVPHVLDASACNTNDGHHMIAISPSHYYISAIAVPPGERMHVPVQGNKLLQQTEASFDTALSTVPNKYETYSSEGKANLQHRAPLAVPEVFEYDDNRKQTGELIMPEVAVLNLCVDDSAEFGSCFSLAEESGSCAGSYVSDSAVSCSTAEVLDYKTLAHLINQPFDYRGQRRNVIPYRPKTELSDWPVLSRKMRLVEETRLLHHAVEKYKVDLQELESTFTLQYQTAYEDLCDDEREEVEEVESILQEIHKQLQETGHLLSHRMKAVNKGNNMFTFLSSLNVIHNIMSMLKEQMYERTVSSSLLQVEEMYQDGDMSHSSLNQSAMFSPSFSHHMSGYGSPYGGLPRSVDLNQSMDEMRRFLVDEMKDELNRSTQKIQLDMQAKDNEIQRLNLELMMQSHTPQGSRSYHSSSSANSFARVTDV